VISPATAATYVTVGSNVDPSSHITFVLSTASASHQGIADLGWYRSQEVILMCVRTTLHCDLPTEMTASNTAVGSAFPQEYQYRRKNLWYFFNFQCSLPPI
jgi:hypothetical protein